MYLEINTCADYEREQGPEVGNVERTEGMLRRPEPFDDETEYAVTHHIQGINISFVFLFDDLHNDDR